MIEGRVIRESEKSFSDSAVDGLFGGLAAGAIMAIVLSLAGTLIGEGPAQVLGRFSPLPTQAPVSGLLMHLAISGIYGTGFGLLARLLPAGLRYRLPAWLAGLGYGTLLLALALGVLIPGLQSPISELPNWILVLAHASYGLVLGLRAYPRLSNL